LTPSKAIRRVLAVLPSTVAPAMRAHSRCVAATRIGIDALAQFGVVALPFAVDVQVFNAAAVQWVLDGSPGGTPEFKRRGAYYLTTLREAVPPDLRVPPSRVNVGPVWDGHLVAHAPAHQLLLDFDARQLSRPEFGIVLPEAIAVPWAADAVMAEAVDDDTGARLVYRPRPDDVRWQAARDWQQPAPDLVRAVVRAARRAPC
jgi:hypothetical protein